MEARGECVGPVLEASEMGRRLARAILVLNPGGYLEDRGSYLRVLVPLRCVLTREAAERELGRLFRLPVDLEPLMPAFKGMIRISSERVEWSLRTP